MLTSQLCGHLNGAARHAVGWDNIQFRTEIPDEVQKGRKIDLVPSPCGVTIWIEGRRHTEFDIILPIECKRLPTPRGKDRDEREYVFSQYSSTGGVQRFKAGNHGAAHTFGAMIAYVQERTTTYWHGRVEEWIIGLVTDGAYGWTKKDLIRIVSDDRKLRIAVLRSSHIRESGPPIELQHLWLDMN